MKINARLDDQSEQDLLFIQDQTGAKMKALLESDFIGCAEGPEDLSENYKDYLYNGLKEKHGIN